MIIFAHELCRKENKTYYNPTIMKLSNGTTEGLIEQYNEIMGSSDNKFSQKEETGNFEYFSMYDKSDYETRTYSNLNNVKL